MINDHDMQIIRNRTENNTIILAFADFNYLEILLNWIIGIKRLGIDNYVVISLDKEIHEYLMQRGFPSILSPLEGDLSQLWIKRMRVFS